MPRTDTTPAPCYLCGDPFAPRHPYGACVVGRYAPGRIEAERRQNAADFHAGRISSHELDYRYGHLLAVVDHDPALAEALRPLGVEERNALARRYVEERESDDGGDGVEVEVG